VTRVLLSFFRYSNAGASSRNEAVGEKKRKFCERRFARERIVNSFEIIYKGDAIVVKHQATEEKREILAAWRIPARRFGEAQDMNRRRADRVVLNTVSLSLSLSSLLNIKIEILGISNLSS
jgi:hypothetical protein